MLDNSVLNQIKPSIEALRDPVDRNFVVEFQTPPSPVPEAFLQDLISESLKVPAHVWKGVLAGLLQVNNRPALRNIAAPTLILWGNKDSIFTRKDQDDLLERISDSRFIEYTAGHALHWEKPDEVAADLLSFLD
jgi:pimeloyl-ACP methyl ester carboxylesterase